MAKRRKSGTGGKRQQRARCVRKLVKSGTPLERAKVQCGAGGSTKARCTRAMIAQAKAKAAQVCR